jgi:hypothetical protein
MKNIFYTYIYLNPLKPGNFNYQEFHFNYEPFYVGKGKEDRIYHHLKEANYFLNTEKESIKDKNLNKHKLNTVNKILRNGKEPIVFKIKENLTEIDAYNFERFLVQLIGRRNKNTGPLTNLTDGGRGSLGLIVSESAKEKNRLAHLGKITSEETKKKLSIVGRKKKSPEHAQHIGDAKRGIPRTEECKQKISQKLKGRKYSKERCIQIGELRKRGKNPRAKKVINLDTKQIFDCVKDACEFYKLDYHYITACCKKRKETDKLGFRWSYYIEENKKEISK